MFSKPKVAAIVAEFLGTFVLSFAVLSVVLRTSFPFFGALTAALTVGVLVLVLGKASGAHFNPAVTLGLWSQRKIDTAQSIVYIAAQLLGGLVAVRAAERLLDPQPLLALSTGGFETKVIIAEALGAFIFTFGIAAAVSSLYEGGKLAATIGGSLFIGIMVASLASNGVLNPAVAIGISSWSWSYAIGPLLGAVLGMSVYNLMFADLKSAKNKSRK
jgi:glycerol uptake facilitator-like aquaporin